MKDEEITPENTKIESKEKAAWIRVKQNAEQAIENAKIEVELNEAILAHSKAKIETIK